MMTFRAEQVFSTAGFMPHGMCYQWRADILTLHVASDTLIALAYFSIPFTLLYFVRKRRDLEFNWMFVCFAVFIVACGATHIMEIWVIWQPAYWLSGSLKALTALASVPTAVLLVKLIPAALRVPNPATLQRAEAELRGANDRLRRDAARGRLAAIVESSDDAIISKTPEGIITSWNHGAEKVFGYTQAEAIGRPAAMLFPPDRAAEESEILMRIARGERLESYESVRVRKNGENIDVSATISPIRDDTGAIVGASKIARDITQQKRAAEVLRARVIAHERAEARLAAQLTRLHLLNDITRAIGEHQDLASIFRVVERTLEEQLPLEFCCVCLYDAASAHLTSSAAGEPDEPRAIDLGLAKQTLREIGSSGLSRCLAGQVVYEPDLHATPLPFPRRMAQSGLCAMVAAPLLVESKVFGVLIAARRAPHSFGSDECEFLRQLSEHVGLAAHQTQLHAALQAAYEELRQTQQAVVRHEKFRVLGQMASGIAHDINNALSPASLYAESLLARDPTLSAEKREHLVIIQRAIDGVAQTVARMKEFYSQRDPQRVHGPVSLNRAIEQALDLTRARWNTIPQVSGIVIRVETELASNLTPIIGDESDIRDALTNLILNAVDALPNGGCLKLRSRVTEHDRVQVEVTDTGTGMDEATRSRCLELFFTTKGARGTGLGLPMVYGMIERHGGELQIDSEVGRGTTMRLIFPAAATRQVEGTGSFAALPPQQPLRILVVDDDPIILRSMQSTLEQDGHTVILAAGGREGIEEFRAAHARGESFSAVITDLGMPHVDGRSVAAAVKSLRPEVPVVLLTGWGTRLQAENYKPANVDRVLSKPPKLATLRVALSELTRSLPP